MSCGILATLPIRTVNMEAQWPGFPLRFHPLQNLAPPTGPIDGKSATTTTTTTTTNPASQGRPAHVGLEADLVSVGRPQLLHEVIDLRRRLRHMQVCVWRGCVVGGAEGGLRGAPEGKRGDKGSLQGTEQRLRCTD